MLETTPLTEQKMWRPQARVHAHAGDSPCGVGAQELLPPTVLETGPAARDHYRERAEAIWKVPPNKAIEANAANEFSRQPDILGRGEAEQGAEESRRKREPGTMAEKDVHRPDGQCSLLSLRVSSPGALTLRPLKGKREPRCRAPFFVFNYFPF